MNKRIFIVLIFAMLILSGCRSGGYHEVRATPPPQRDSKPYLEEFHIIDSFGNDTYDFAVPSPVIDPYVDDGLFEVYWFVDSLEDYIVEYRINNAPFVEDSRIINSDICGIGLTCDQDGLQYCQYYPDFSITCETNDSNQTYVVDVSDMIETVPQTLYLILQVC